VSSGHFDSLHLPAYITDRVEMLPVEDIILAVFADELPELPISSLIPFDLANTDFFAIVRRIPLMGNWGGDPRFLDKAQISIHVFARDPNADEKGAVISEAIRVTLRNAATKQTVYPDLGHVVKVEMRAEPAQKPDWASGSADLPSGYFRHEAQYALTIRRPL